MTPADPAGHHNDEATPAVVAVAASSLAAAAAPQPVSRQARELEAVATSTESDTTTTETTTTTKTTTKTIAAAATTADDPAATTTADTPAPTSAANTTKTTAAAAISTPITTAAAAAANTDTTTTSSTAAITTSPIVAVEPAQPSPLPLQEDPIDQERRKEDTRQQLPPRTSSPQDSGKGRPGAHRANTADSETETDMSNHRPGPPAAAHHHHHNQDLNHHHHSHSLSAGYPASTSSGSPTIYSASAAALSTTQYAAASYPVTSTSILATDPFRVSPIASSQMPLPSMRTIDAISQGQMSVVAPLPHHSMSMTMGMPLVAVSATAPYYAGHSMALSSNYALPQDLVQFPLPPHDPRLLNHRGPKKEIKRRTKTGCLTCRKRRIKCDETHPTCNNCRKSKRDCLGYDPIFRQQNSNQGGNTIQPSPGSLPPSPPALASAAVYQNISLAQLPGSRVATSYGTSSSMLPGAYSPATTAPSPTSSSIPTSTSTTYHPSLPTTAAPSPAVVKVEGSCDYSTSNLDPTIRQFPSTPDLKAGQVSEGHFPRAYNKMKISEIIDLLGPTASPQQISHTEETFHEITKVYHEMYAPGLSAFFETGWYYFTENGKMSFPKDANLIERMATFLKILEGIRANDHSQIALSGALETRIVWELACTAYQTPERTSPMRISLPTDNDASEARNRVQVVEALLCGDYLPTNLLSPPVSDNDHHRIRQFDFWYCLGEFVRKQDNPSAPMNVKSREDALSRMRHLLDGRENRDVLYSIAVVRELAPGFEAGYASTIPQHLDETDPKNRLAVASKFILDESQVSGGTTNVVRRFSDIAARAFVNPGVNIVRRA